ncbi:Zn-dependent hydrolase [Rhodococcus sp. NPDC059968]|uniref:Zn-dependent hydrolase n=1 Tax=Rhodococcus sp. NPDC059968 TaxID=3347017 RepID=UPI003670AC21
MRIDGNRLLTRLDQLAAIGADPAGGVTRLAYSPEDVRARSLVAGWMTQAGLSVRIDPAGNLIGRLPGAGRHQTALVLGSHLDTVPEGGPLDGAYGVLAAVEAADTVQRHGLELAHDLVVVAFSNEEGARGTPGMVGAKAIAGALTAADLNRADGDGVTLSERIACAGGDPARIAKAQWDTADVAGFLEMHIEQGPLLEQSGHPIGVVTAITGQSKVDVVVTGTANHAGTTPMVDRQDAAVAAARLILAVEALAVDGHVRVATTGRVRVQPGIGNTIPREAVLGIDLRDTDDEKITAALHMLAADAEVVARQTGTTIEFHPGSATSSVLADLSLRRCIAAAANSLGAPSQELPSGAGHDAQIMSRLGPMAMIFVPSTGGISHSPHETSNPGDLVLGADVLLRTLLLADGRDITHVSAFPVWGSSQRGN